MSILTQSEKALVWKYLDSFLRKGIIVTFERFAGEIRCILEGKDAQRVVSVRPIWYEGLSQASDIYSFIEKGE